MSELSEQSELKRPVKCHFCGEQMYYINDKRHRSEVRIEIHGNTNRTFDNFFAHKDCFEDNFLTRAFFVVASAGHTTKHEFLQYPLGMWQKPEYNNGRCWHVDNHLYCGKPLVWFKGRLPVLFIHQKLLSVVVRGRIVLHGRIPLLRVGFGCVGLVSVDALASPCR